MITRVGAHVSREDSVAEAQAIGADAIQVFLSDPQKWKGPVADDELLNWAAGVAEADIAIYVHAPYVINVASPNNRIRIPSRKLLAATVSAAAACGAAGVVVHGGHVTADTAPEVGISNWVKAVDALDMTCPVLLENTAGGKHAMARTLPALAALWEQIGDSGIGFCLDTCHAWAGGIPLSSAVDEIRAITGCIDLVHANDSKGGFNSGQDRHCHIGEGTCDTDELLTAIVDADAAAVICETSYPEVADDIARVRAALTAS